MNIVKMLVAVMAFTWLAGCAIETAPNVSVNTVEGTVEPLVSSKRWEHLLMFVAQSTGCTDDKSFELQIDKVEAGKVSVSVIRPKPDYSRRAPMYEEFQLAWRPQLKEVDVEL